MAACGSEGGRSEKTPQTAGFGPKQLFQLFSRRFKSRDCNHLDSLCRTAA